MSSPAGFDHEAHAARWALHVPKPEERLERVLRESGVALSGPDTQTLVKAILQSGFIDGRRYD